MKRAATGFLITAFVLLFAGFAYRTFPSPASYTVRYNTIETGSRSMRLNIAVKQADGTIKSEEEEFPIPHISLHEIEKEKYTSVSWLQTAQWVIVVFFGGFFACYSVFSFFLWSSDKYHRRKSDAHTKDNAQRLNNVLGVVVGALVSFIGLILDTAPNTALLAAEFERDQLREVVKLTQEEFR